MRKTVKKLTALMLCTCLTISLNACSIGLAENESVSADKNQASAQVAQDAVSETSAENISKPVQGNAEEEKTDNSFELFFAAGKFDTDLICYGNRPYVCKESLENLFGLLDISVFYPIKYHDGKEYVSLADACKAYSLAAEFSEDEKVVIYKKAPFEWSTAPGSHAKTAYIRLEDIEADYGLNGRFTYKGLEKLRAMSDYLEYNADAFYIAWIPCYVNPEKGIENNIATDFNYYNTDFLFTLDYMVLSGGKLGLHGYTHQSGDEVSADGYEFGKNIKLSKEEVLAKFDAAASVCKAIGHEYYFFEFPHYEATPKEMEMASAYFDAVFQQSFADKKKIGHIVSIEQDGHQCLWVPTPADYVYSSRDKDGIISRLEDSYNKGYDLALFFHPALDYAFISCELSADTKIYAYDTENAILPAIVEYLALKEYSFGEF